MERTEVYTEKQPPVAVIGAGHGGMAMAGHLSLMGHEVRLFNRGEDRLWGVRSTGGIEVRGEVAGFGRVALVTNSMEEAMRGAELLMVVVPALAHRWVAGQMAPHLVDGQIVVLHPGRTMGAVEFRQVLTENRVTADVVVSEAQTFIYASRVVGPAQVHILGIKQSIPVASVRAHRIPHLITKLRAFYPQFVPGDNIFKTSFDNIGCVFHPAICVLNSGWIEDDTDFKFYHEGATESVARVLESVDQERIAVAEALGIRAITARQWFYMAYGTTGETLHEAMRKNPGYRTIMAPKTLKVRYIEEDVPCSLVPISSLGAMFGVPTPTIDSLIRVASVLNNRDYRAEGRTAERLGIAGMSLRDLRLLAIGEKSTN